MINREETRPHEPTAYADPQKMNSFLPTDSALREPTLGELFVVLSEDLSALFHKEADLVRIEMQEKLQTTTSNLINLAMGGIFLLLGVAALVAALILALGNVIAYWLAALLVGVLTAFVGLILVQSAKGNLTSLTLMPEKSLAAIKEDTKMVKEKMQ